MIGIAKGKGNASAAAKIALIALSMCVLLLALVPSRMALAAESSSSSSSAASSSSVASKYVENAFMMGNDYVWAGESASLSGVSVDNDVLGAGRDFRIDDSTVHGSIRVAGATITVSDTAVKENITIAGETLKINGGLANAVAMAGQTATFSGECDDLAVFAGTARIEGVVNGDAVVEAGTVEIGPDAVITGTLHVTASAEPNVPKSAKIGDIDVKIEEQSSDDVEAALAGMSAGFVVLNLVLGLLGTLAVALLAEWLFRRHTLGAAEMIRNRTAPTIVSGVVGAFVAPIVIILLCCFVITLPAAGASTLALIAMTVVATGFMGASIFKLAFPKLGRFVVALIGGAIMAVASVIPFVGALVTAVAFMYFLGYVIQSMFLSMRGKPTPGDMAVMAAQQPIAQVAPAPSYVAPAPAAAPVSGVQPMASGAPVPPAAAAPMATAAPVASAPVTTVPPIQAAAPTTQATAGTAAVPPIGTHSSAAPEPPEAFKQ